MVSSFPGYTDPQRPQAQPTRLPKLSYRTKSCDTQSVNSVSTGFTRSIVSTAPTSPFQSDFCLSPRPSPSEMSLPSSPRQSTFASSPKKSSNLSKKRSNFLSGLFSAREPSAQALQEYQRQLAKQGGGRITAVGMPGVSSAKLPATVPKVNSKWDGVPQTLKEKEKQNDRARQSMSGLEWQVGISRSGESEYRATSRAGSSRNRLSRGTLGGVSIQSGSSNNLAELYGWETDNCHNGCSVIDFSAEHRPTTSRSVSSLQQSSSPLYDSSRPPTIPLSTPDLSPPSRFSSPNPPALSYSPMLTPDESSPATPATPPPFISLISPKSEASSQENTKTNPLELPVSTKEVIVKSAGVNILGPPAAAKRKPKPTPLQPSDQCPSTSGADFQSRPILRREGPIQKNTPSPRPTVAAYFTNNSRTPNSDSPAKAPARQNSMRKSLKDQIAVPWHSPEQGTVVNAEVERITTPTPAGKQSLRRKSRMTLFKK